MAVSSSGFTTHPDFKRSRLSSSPFHANNNGLELRKKKRRLSLFLDGNGVRVNRISSCCCSDSVVRRASGSGNSIDKTEEKRSHRSRVQAITALPFPSPQYVQHRIYPLSLWYFLGLLINFIFFKINFGGLASVRNKRSFIRDVRRELPAHSREIHRRREVISGDWVGFCVNCVFWAMLG